MDYHPDSWIIVEIKHEGESIRKVLGGWSGGYLDGDSWRLSSGITNVEDCQDHYKIDNESGSTYYCNKESQRISMIIQGTLNNLKRDTPDGCSVDVIEL